MEEKKNRGPIAAIESSEGHGEDARIKRSRDIDKPRMHGCWRGSSRLVDGGRAEEDERVEDESRRRPGTTNRDGRTRADGASSTAMGGGTGTATGRRQPAEDESAETGAATGGEEEDGLMATGADGRRRGGVAGSSTADPARTDPKRYVWRRTRTSGNGQRDGGCAMGANGSAATDGMGNCCFC